MPQFCIATSKDNGKKDYNADGCNGCPGKIIAGVRLNTEPLVTLENHMGKNDNIKVTKKGNIKITNIGYFFDGEKIL